MNPSPLVHETELLLAVRADIPAIKQSLSDLKDSLDEVQEAVSGVTGEHNTLAAQVGGLKDAIAEMKTESAKRFDLFESQLVKIATKEEAPWYKSFEKVMIFVLILTLGSLAGVKQYSDYLNKVTDAVVPAVVAPVTGVNINTPPEVEGP